MGDVWLCGYAEDGDTPLWVITDVELCLDQRARTEWCTLSYPGHPKGCPNFGKRDTCPPIIPWIEDVYDLDMPVFFVTVRFDLAAHVARMLEKHSDWSDRQARCCLYWQGTVNKDLRQRVDAAMSFLARFMGLHNYESSFCPEAMGVNVIKTAKRAGIPISSKPRNTVYKIAMLARPLEEVEG